MNFDEQKLKRPDNIRLNDNQNENVIPINLKHKIKKRAFLTALFFAYSFHGGRKVNLTNLCSLILTNHIEIKYSLH